MAKRMEQVVWVPDPKEGFVLATIVDLGMDEVTVQPVGTSKANFTLPLDRMYTADPHFDNKDVDDNCSLMHLNEATLLNNVKIRYSKDKIYTYVANILISVNPYIEIKNLYSTDVMQKYKGKSLGVLPPHIFAIADKSFRDMKVLKQSQSIIVSGESGAGKTESTKHLLRYLCYQWGSSNGPTADQKILDANPVLEAFGNAKTTRNNNSSRFGKFMEVHFDNSCSVVGGYISHYLLEKSRVCIQSSEERNYHVFYLLCAGAPLDLRSKLSLDNPDAFNYLRKGCTQYFTNNQTSKMLENDQKSKLQNKQGGLKDPMLDDVKGFSIMDEALSRLGLSNKERCDIYTIVAAVLHLGNIEFEENIESTKGGCKVTEQTERSLSVVAKLLSVDVDELRQALITKVMMTNRGGLKGTVIMVPLKQYEANNARDALAKAIYGKLFDNIVHRINSSIPSKASNYYIGVLDIAGFEYFTVNSFEQFCINYCNEKLQQFFNERILKEEQMLYEREGLAVRKIEFVDNQDCIDLIESKNGGIFNLLDEESKLPKQSSEHFTTEVHKRWQGHFRLALARASRLKAHREIRDDEGFMVRHFAGAVCYQTSQFIDKNNDALHANLEGLVQESNNPFLQSLFATSTLCANKGKLNFISVGSKFKSQLAELMEKLRSTGTNFVRCIKPNDKMVDHLIDGGSILSQLQCSGMTSVLELMQQGFPSRAPFQQLYDMYKQRLPPKLARLDPRIFSKALFRAVGVNEGDYKFGVSKVFFRPGKFAEFDAIMHSDPENLKQMIEKVQKYLTTLHWKQSQWCALSVIKLKNKILYRQANLIIIQKNVRMHLSKIKHRPRYMGIKKINSLKTILNEMETLAGQIKKDNAACVSDAQKLRIEFDLAIKKIRNNENINAAEINNIYNSLVKAANSQMESLRKKASAEKSAEAEKQRLAKLQKEMEIVKAIKDKEEHAKLEDEQIKKQKIEIELRRKAEEEIHKNDIFLSKEEIDKAELAELKFREQMEQERRDHELALRLAQETNSFVEDISNTYSKRTTSLEQPSSKYDLSKWKYSELRDTINTSCDIELLEACRVEFHRRLKVYHAWKAKNKKRTYMDDNERVPRSIMDTANQSKGIKHYQNTKVQSIIPTSSQRYFRIPFVRSNTPTRPPGSGGDQHRGWWYAHFDGQYVARQMELHPDKPAILLNAGKDDMQMCELSLDETGLTRKRGAEILENDFNKEWEKHGGKSYTRNNVNN
ncbi:myosin heavy chain 95F isoform X1 [Aphis craccivora]|uniref:Myosin heavy chain 95F isoform X1 n=1 Tax=Aphis craccivora TaxID=307492 RepID=A0A6G0YWF7_APHCR|nr:myosin heavy chain 95F isoform X1 [Aphis craccivora]